MAFPGERRELPEQPVPVIECREVTDRRSVRSLDFCGQEIVVGAIAIYHGASGDSPWQVTFLDGDIATIRLMREVQPEIGDD